MSIQNRHVQPQGAAVCICEDIVMQNIGDATFFLYLTISRLFYISKNIPKYPPETKKVAPFKMCG